MKYRVSYKWKAVILTAETTFKAIDLALAVLNTDGTLSVADLKLEVII